MPTASANNPQAAVENKPAPYAEMLKPIARGQMGPAISPYAPTSTAIPQRMPSSTIGPTDDLPVPAAVSPATNTPVNPGSPFSRPDLDQPLFAYPQGAPPFICDPQRFRVSAEYLMWWTRGTSVPQLLTTGPAATNGFLGSPGVSTVLGGGPLNSTFTNGLRVGGLWYFDPCMLWGVDGSFFMLGNNGSTYSFGSPGDPLLARPFFNVNDGIPFSELVAYPGVLQGGIKVSTGSTMWGADVNLRRRLFQWENSRLDFLFGYRHLTLDEYVNIDEMSVGLPGSIASGLNAYAYDHFRTTNNFNGGQIGLAFERTAGRWVFDLRGKVAFGITSQNIDVSGGQTIFNPNGSTTNYTGGLLALPSNIGVFSKNEFSVAPEVTMNIGYNITNHCRVFVGYNFLYWTNVVRPGSEISTNVNINQIPNFTTSPSAGTVRPVVQFHEKEYWAMGINFGFMFKW
jgi:hypothetical protein